MCINRDAVRSSDQSAVQFECSFIFCYYGYYIGRKTWLGKGRTVHDMNSEGKTL